MMDAGRHPGIQVHTCAEVASLAGEAGAFRAVIRRRFTGVDASRCTGCGDCADACPVTAPNPFDIGLGTRKAIFRPFPQAVPAAYAIDPLLCLNRAGWIACERCRAACPREAIDLEQRDEEREVEVGAVIVATGFDEFDPRALRNYGYGVYPNVMTSLELERLLNASGPTLGHVVRPSDGRPPRRIVYVQCVGARGEAGRPYCSRFCCMNAVKDALLLRQHDPGIEAVTILYTDVRAFGKGFDELYERARSQPWIDFVRGRPAKIVEDPGTRDLQVLVEDTERGAAVRIRADLVVLSCAGEPAAGTAEIAARLGIETNAAGFIATPLDRGPVQTSRPGVFVCGSAGGPQVIPDCVAQGSAAATESAIVMRRAGATRAAGASGAPREGATDAPRTADLEEIDLALLAGPIAAEADRPRRVAHDMVEIAEAIAAGSWRNRLADAPPATAAPVSATTATAPATAQHSPGGGVARDAAPEVQRDDSREAAAPAADPLAEPRIGLFLCHCGVNIAGVLGMPELLAYARELPGVVHAAEELFACSAGAQATIRDAIVEQRLDRVVVAACTPRTHEPIFRRNCEAGGLNPYLLEMVNIRDQCSWVHTQAPEAATAKARDLLRMAVARARHLQPLAASEVETTRRVLVIGGGLPGMKAASDLSALGFEVVLIEQAAQLGGLLTQLHTLYPDRERAEAAIATLTARLDESAITLRLGTRLAGVEGFVGNFRARLIAVEDPGHEEEIAVGAIVIAIGAEPYAPAPGEFGHGTLPNVITALELEQRLRDPADRLAGVRAAAFIQCVGSRTAAAGTDAARGYAGCSRICCPTTIKQALELQHRGIDTVVFYRDLRMAGAGLEELYREARGSGTLFVRVPETHPPRVVAEAGRAAAVVAEETLLRTDVRAAVDLVVLATGLVPRVAEAGRIQELLKTPKGADGFFLERHPELGPVETCVDGVFVCGTAQGPKELRDALAQASAAASKASALLGSGRLLLDPAVCRVDPDRCRGCGLCVSICEFQAPGLTVAADGSRLAAINAALCKGCGTCAVWCPTSAIAALHFTDAQITAMIDGLFLTEAAR
jgi:heterodisulfide reductase subunit A-like polyferredoxin